MMKEETSALFGKKEVFAIEIKPYKIPKKFYLRFWFNNKAIGDFKRGGSLDYLINGYFKLLNIMDESLYAHEFNNLSDYEIFRDIFLYSDKSLTSEEEDFYFNRMEKLGYIFADNQLNDFTFGVIPLKSEIKFLIYEMDGKTAPKLYSFHYNKLDILTPYKSFMQYAFKNSLKKNGLFFPENFSIKDIQ